MKIAPKSDTEGLSCCCAATLSQHRVAVLTFLDTSSPSDNHTTSTAMSVYDCTVKTQPGSAPDDAKGKTHHVKDKSGNTVGFANTLPSYGRWKDLSLLRAGGIFFRYVVVFTLRSVTDLLYLAAIASRASFPCPIRLAS
jgi:hypothetical protein